MDKRRTGKGGLTMKYKVTAKAGMIVFECGYRYTNGNYIRRPQKDSGLGDRTERKEAD